MRKSAPALLLSLLALLLAGCQTPIPAGLAFGPYCTDVTPSSAKVLWVMEPGEDAISTFTFGDPGAAVYEQSKAIYGQPQMLHVAHITGIEAGKEYTYKLAVAQKDKPLTQIAGQFQTAPPADSTAPLRFVIYGDTRTFPLRHHEIAEAVAAEKNVAFIALSGDLCGDGSRFPLWKKEFFDPAADLLSHTVCWPGRGNHERDGVLFNMLFDMPRSYYSFDYGNVHFVEIDSDMAELVPGELHNNKADPALLLWLEKDLAASKATWKIVEYHRPTFDAITHRATWGQTDLLPILEKGGVDMVFNGHTHNYQRFCPIGSETGHPIIFVVSAGGGAPNYPINDSPILEKAYSGIHYCVLDVSGNTLEMTAKLPGGSVLDHLKLVKNADGTFQKDVMDQAVTTSSRAAHAVSADGDLCLFAAAPGCGKAFHAQHLAAAVSGGCDGDDRDGGSEASEAA